MGLYAGPREGNIFHMSNVQPQLDYKLDQSRFFLSQLSQEHDASRRAYYFSAFLSSLRSVVLYVRAWLEEEGVIAERNDRQWSAKITPWEQRLSIDKREKWQVITRLRNTDIHEEPMVPDECTTGSYLPPSYFPPSYFAPGYFGGARVLKIKHPDSGIEYDLLDTCKTAIDVAQQLIQQHTALR